MAREEALVITQEGGDGSLDSSGSGEVMRSDPVVDVLRRQLVGDRPSRIR